MGLSAQNVHSTVGEFQREYLYKLYIEFLPYPVAARLVGTSIKNAYKFMNDVDIYNTKAVFPNRETEGMPLDWMGDTTYIPSVNKSKKEADLEFFDDEDKCVWNFFSAMKDMTGIEETPAPLFPTLGKANFGVAQVSVDKKTITCYRHLIGVRVFSLDLINGLNKEGEDISKVKVSIKWDKNVEDSSLKSLNRMIDRVTI